MTGDLFINGKDAWAEYRANLEEGSVFELLNAQPKKDHVESNVRSRSGRIMRNIDQDDIRDLTLMMHICGTGTANGYELYNKFSANVLAPGKFTLKSRYSEYTFELVYKRSLPVSSNNGLLKFSLRVIDNCSRKIAE